MEPFQIPTGSMIPTLKVGDFILVNKYAYGIRLPVVGTKIIDVGDPERGDNMVFIPPHEEEYFIKRVIGLPGDRVRYQNKTLYINGVEQTQVFQQEVRAFRPRQLEFEEIFGDRPHAIYRNLYNDPRVQEWVVPEGHYFMMGDNRDQSNDSRFGGLSQTKTSSAELLRFGCIRIRDYLCRLFHNPLDPLSSFKCPDIKSKQHSHHHRDR